MIHLTLPINNTASVVIGDVYVHCEVRFNPQIPPDTAIEKITVDQLNTRLQEMGYRLAAEISNKIEKELRGEK